MLAEGSDKSQIEGRREPFSKTLQAFIGASLTNLLLLLVYLRFHFKLLPFVENYAICHGQ